MNAATILIVLFLAALLAFAVRYLFKNGMCAACADKGACHAKETGGCSGHCASCSSCCSGTDKQNK